MAMLAEPRRKQKAVNLRGNSTWSKDSSKFGQRLLERMGWAPGKGLGAREDGVTAHIVARYKNDDHGLGYNDRNDQWTQHEDSFESLLAGLNSETPVAMPQHVSTSLEQKSKKSRARVHYHKFTRGKDISRYSKKDLDSIFGKKSLKNEETKSKKGKVQQMIRKSEDEDEEQPQQVFTCGGDMADYFKIKLEALGQSKLTSISPSPSDLNEKTTQQDLAQKQKNQDNLQVLPQKKKKKKKRTKGEDNVQNSMVVSQQEVSETEKNHDFINKKKKKKMCDSEKCFENSVNDEYDLLKKKRTKCVDNIQNIVVASQQQIARKENNHDLLNQKRRKKCDFENTVKDERDQFNCGNIKYKNKNKKSEALYSGDSADKAKKKKMGSFDQQDTDCKLNLMKKKKKTRHRNVL